MKEDLIIVSVAHNYHDSNLSISRGSQILFSLEAERFFRSKKIQASPSQIKLLVNYALHEVNLKMSDVDYFVLGALNNPYEQNQNTIAADLRISGSEVMGLNIPTLTIRHHLGHAGHYYFSDFDDALIASCDGGGDQGERVVYFKGNDLQIERIEFNTEYHISTKPYGQFAAFIYGRGFCEGRLMALASYGKRNVELFTRVSNLFHQLKEVTFKEGQETIKEAFPEYCDLNLNEHFDDFANLGWAIQEKFTSERLANIKSVYQEQESSNLVLVGGSALNIHTNSAIYSEVSENIYIPPNCDDTGIAVGQNAVAIAHLLKVRPEVILPYSGFEPTDINRNSKTLIIEDLAEAAMRIRNGELCLAHIGRPEVGPRALGHRSFLFRPNDIELKKIVSEKIKGREWYRPVAPVILEEDLKNYFGPGPSTSKYMLFQYQANDQFKQLFPGIAHSDNSVRVQSIGETDCQIIRILLQHYKQLTGHGVLINTSLNLNNEPLANSLWDTQEIARKIHVPNFILRND
ncbi:carbamoyltransferase C-terminal domain-containing protein [Fulvivirgaceae bacterium BMA10]|uniref:Carbamoyltransferase C-terminal domain-containing protein n=1 Tax=Splendidivirga corallicola TaxID=3051826 RepID=A0ABT8KNV5_9BACT|nr:carbamoyltransferase C-terminal domain-containing protein [Fulvivirgaceae bacterium BMA10]